MDQLLTLKGFSDEQARLDKYVEDHDRRFEKLAEAVKTGGIQEYPSQEAVLKAFGEPVTHDALVEGQDRWMYRPAVKFFDSEKVFLYFNAEAQLVAWQHQPERPASPPGESEKTGEQTHGKIP